MSTKKTRALCGTCATLGVPAGSGSPSAIAYRLSDRPYRYRTGNCRAVTALIRLIGSILSPDFILVDSVFSVIGCPFPHFLYSSYSRSSLARLSSSSSHVFLEFLPTMDVSTPLVFPFPCYYHLCLTFVCECAVKHAWNMTQLHEMFSCTILSVTIRPTLKHGLSWLLVTWRRVPVSVRMRSFSG